MGRIGFGFFWGVGGGAAVGGSQMLSSVQWKQCICLSQSECSGPAGDSSLLTQICRQAVKEGKKENIVIHQVFKLQPLLFIKKTLCELA